MRTSGNITRRGKKSWRLKFDLGRDPITGRRNIQYMTVHGKRQDAQRELTKVLNAASEGTLVEPSKITVAEHLRSWLKDATELAPKTRERYDQLAEQQIIPHLGATPLQKLRPSTIQEWHATLLKKGGTKGGPLSARTVGHAHRVLHRGLERGVKVELLYRNVASAIEPPKADVKEVEALTAGQMASVLAKLDGHMLHPIIAVALGSGMRRGELLALRWSDLDLEGATVRVEQSLEETKQGLRLKEPKTKHGRRTISLPSSIVQILKAHWLKQIELRLALGQGKPEPDALVFSKLNGSPLSPDNLSRDWRRAIKRFKLPKVMFHALRHSHASALIASGLDVLTVSRRLGHATPVVTLNTYAHLFEKTDSLAATAIEAALQTKIEH